MKRLILLLMLLSVFATATAQDSTYTTTRTKVVKKSERLVKKKRDTVKPFQGKRKQSDTISNANKPIRKPIDPNEEPATTAPEKP